MRNERRSPLWALLPAAASTYGPDTGDRPPHVLRTQQRAARRCRPPSSGGVIRSSLKAGRGLSLSHARQGCHPDRGNAPPNPPAGREAPPGGLRRTGVGTMTNRPAACSARAPLGTRSLIDQPIVRPTRRRLSLLFWALAQDTARRQVPAFGRAGFAARSHIGLAARTVRVGRPTRPLGSEEHAEGQGLTVANPFDPDPERFPRLSLRCTPRPSGMGQKAMRQSINYLIIGARKPLGAFQVALVRLSSCTKSL